MTDLHEYELRDQFESENGNVALSGVQALVRGPLDQVRADRANGFDTAGLITGYQGSPLGGVDMVYNRNRAVMVANRVRFEYGVNEELAATMVWGSQQAGRNGHPRHDGVVGLWFAKGPGLDRAGDAIRHANAAGVSRRDGVIAAVGDDPACKSSTMPSASEAALAELSLPTLYPGSVQEVLDYSRFGYAMSRACGNWVGMKIHTDVADATATVNVGRDRLQISHNPFVVDGVEWQQTCNDDIIQPAAVGQEHEAYMMRPQAAAHFAEVNQLDRVEGATKDAWLGIAAAGKTYYDLRSALARLGLADDADLARLGVRLYKPAVIWPLGTTTLRRFATGLDVLLVIEEKRPFLEQQIKSALYDSDSRPAVIGKHDPEGRPCIPALGALDPDAIAAPLRTVLLRKIDAEQLSRQRDHIQVIASGELPTRSPYFCSGCPHNRSTEIPEGSVAGAGIGCHGMVLFVDGDRAVGITQMGGEGAQWAGQAPFVTENHRFQNIGDGTFAHSGIMAIRQAVAGGTNITYKILYNATVAMTGGQDAAGQPDVPDLTRLLDAEGIGRIVVVADDPDKYPLDAHFAAGVDIVHRDHLDKVQRELRQLTGPSVIVYDQRCAAELRRDRKRNKIERPRTRVVINEAVCDGCGHCGAISNCMSVHPVDTPLGRKTRIHQESCNVDLSCLDGECPAFVTVTVDPSKAGVSRPASAVDLLSRPDPQEPVIADEASVLTVGIGGTGVVTVNQILMTAALLDGKEATSLDQTGLAQKGGPVVSHLHIGSGATGAASRLTEGSADTYLVFDVVAGVAAPNLSRSDPNRTIAVVSTSSVPTGHMVASVDKESFPNLTEFQTQINGATRSDANLWIDAETIARQLFQSQPAANLLLLGAAYQSGLIPVSSDAIRQAITLNGVAVDLNHQAFRVGRLIAEDPTLAEPFGDPTASPVAPAPTATTAGLAARLDDDPELQTTLAWRLPELVAFGGQSWATRYVEVVERARTAEREVAGTSAFSVAVASQLAKLMTYKDEYEVARLHRDPAFARQIQTQFGDHVSMAYQLRPPTLVALGYNKKVAIPRWAAGPVFGSLRRMRPLRGTRFDPFGRTNERKIERSLIEEYIQLVDELSSSLGTDTLDEATRIAGLADQVRGYGHVKLANVSSYRNDVQVAITAWRATT